jgi:hypothetical protein
MKSKKELKEEYKQMKFRMGVFQIRNTVNNKIFVESSTDLISIWNRHRFQLNLGSHPNAGLQKDWNALGEGKFTYEIVSEIKQSESENVDYQKEIKLLEEMVLEELQPYNEKGYNRRSKK